MSSNVSRIRLDPCNCLLFNGCLLACYRIIVDGVIASLNNSGYVNELILHLTLLTVSIRLGETFIVDGNDKEKQYDLDVLLGHLAPGQERIVPEGTITQYMCNHGYHLEGNGRTVCVAEEWKGDLPECIGTDYIVEHMYSATSLARTPFRPNCLSSIERCP